MAKLLRKYSDVFSSVDHDVGLTGAVRHEIPLTAGTVPIRQPTRRLKPEKEKEVSRQVRDLLDCGLIEPAQSVWSSLVALVRKKDGSWRFCVDFRKLNSVTIQDAYPLPRIDKLLDVRLVERLLEGPSESRRPGEGGVYYAGQTVEVEGVAVWTDLRPSHLLEADGTSPQRTLLEDTADLP